MPPKKIPRRHALATAAAKADKEKIKTVVTMTTAATETMTAAMAHGRTSEVADTTNGEALALPGTVEDAMAAGALPGDRRRHRPTRGTAIVLSRK